MWLDWAMDPSFLNPRRVYLVCVTYWPYNCLTVRLMRLPFFWLKALSDLASVLQQPYMQVRGQPTVDGFFAMPRAQFGAPDIPTAEEVVRITVFPTTSVPMQSDKPGDLISPDLLDRWVGQCAGWRFARWLVYLGT